MTRIKIKTDLFRREVTVERTAHGSNRFRMSCIGFTPIYFEAETTGQAVDFAEERFTSMSKDPDYKSNRVPRPLPVPKEDATPNPVTPLVQAKRAKQPIEPLPAAKV